MFFDADESDLIIPEVDQARAGQTSLWQALRSAQSMEAIETDYWGNRWREERSVYQDMWGDVIAAAGESYVQDWFATQGVNTDQMGWSMTPESLWWQRGALFRIMRDLAEAGDERFANAPRSEVDVRDIAMQRLNEEYLDAAANVEMSGRGGAVAGFVGRMSVAATDQASLALMPLGGGGGSVLRIAGREAVLGAVGEAVIIPRMYDVAEEIDAVQDPDPVQQITMGAVFGGAIGGGMAAAGRGWQYLRERNANIPAPLMTPSHVAEQIVAQVEETLARNEAPLPFQPAAVERQAEPPAVQPEPVAPMATQEDLAAATAARRAAEAEARAQFGSLTRPVLTTLRQSGIQIDPSSEIAAELRALGVTSRTAPGFYSRTRGTGALDNLVADEFPALREIVRYGDMDGYFDLQDLLDAIGEEVGGRPRLPMAIRDVMDARDAEISIERVAEELGSRVIDAPDRASTLDYDDSFFPTLEMDRATEAFLTDDDMGDMLTRFERAQRAVERGNELSGGGLSQDEITYAAGRLAETGGYVEDAIYDAIARTERDLETPDARGQEPAGAGTETLPEDAFPVERAGNDAGAAPRASPQDGRSGGAFERTAAGEQSLIPGVEPVSQRQRLEVALNQPMRGGDAPADVGLFDAAGRLQRDMFDDPASPAAAEYMDRLEAEFRADEEFMSMTTDRDIATPRDLLSDIEADRRHLEAIRSCQIGGQQ